MQKKIKLIWDFRGPNSTKIAEHHAIHLKEFAISEKIENPIIGQESINTMHNIAFMVVEEGMVNSLRESLKPNRGQLYDQD